MGSFWKKAKDIHFDPTEFYKDLDGEGYSEASKFAATVGLIFGALISLFGVFAVAFGEFNPGSFVFIAAMLLIFIPLMFILSAFFQAGLAHIAVYLFGERGFDTTYNAIAYPVSAVALWGWIPLINLFAGIYSIYLQSKGLEVLHDMDLGKAFIAVVWPILLSIVLITILWIVLLAGALTA